MSLTDEDVKIVVDNLDLARMEAARFTRRGQAGDVLGSAYYGLCRAALKRPRPESFRAYARLECRYQIIEDRERWSRRRIGRSGMSNQYRKVSPLVAEFIPLGAFDAPGRDAEPIHAAIRREQRKWIDLHVSELTPFRARIVLLTLQGLGIADVAETLGKNYRNVQITLLSTIRKLREEYGDVIVEHGTQ